MFQNHFMNKFKPSFQIELYESFSSSARFKEKSQVGDSCISDLSNALVLCKPQKDLSIELPKK